MKTNKLYLFALIFLIGTAVASGYCNPRQKNCILIDNETYSAENITYTIRTLYDYNMKLLGNQTLNELIIGQLNSNIREKNRWATIKDIIIILLGGVAGILGFYFDSKKK